MTKTTDQPQDAIDVHIVMVLDESGSMAGLRDDLIGGVNKFLADQRSKPGKCRLTLVKFAPYTVLADAVDIKDVADLTHATYNPQSMTPLFDAEGRAINEALAREEKRARKGKSKEAVLFVTYTDGDNNTSREFTRESLSKLKAERSEAGWTFLYLGVGHDAYGQSSSMGTSTANTRSRSKSARGMATVFSDVNNVATAYRTAAFVGDADTIVASSADAYSALNVDAPVDEAEAEAKWATSTAKDTATV